MIATVSVKIHNSENQIYLTVGNKEYYLFSQKYKQSVVDYYSRGVILEKALDFSKSRRDVGITKTMEKLPVYIRNIEKEYSIQILNASVRRKAG